MSIKDIWEHRKEVAKQRMDICSTCEEFVPTTTQCQECGCFIIAKSLLPFSECPLKKWESYQEHEKSEE